MSMTLKQKQEDIIECTRFIVRRTSDLRALNDILLLLLERKRR